MLYDDLVQSGTYLAHHGIKGQKWGVRRYQNSDGSLTAEGERRYGTVENFKKSRDYRKYRKQEYITTAKKVNNEINNNFGKAWEVRKKLVIYIKNNEKI